MEYRQYSVTGFVFYMYQVVSESYLDDESMITDPPPGENDTQMEHDDVEPKFKEVETQTDMKSCVRCRQNTRRMNAWRLRVKASSKLYNQVSFHNTINSKITSTGTLAMERLRDFNKPAARDTRLKS